MTGVHHSLNGTQSEIGLSLESSVGQGRQDKVSNGSAEEERDSGDSLFITQKTGTLPEAGRSGRRPLYSRRSKPVSPRDLEESEDSSSSTSCNEELKTQKWRRRKYSLPKYSFPFLQERKLQSGPLPDQNKSLHNYTIGSFFKCLGELRQSSRRGENLESSLPTVDMDRENLSLLSEEEGERSEDEDIKVVERKHFVASAKTKSQQTWCNQLKEQRRRKIDTQKGKASKPVVEQAGPRPGIQRLLHRPPDRTAVTKVKKRRKEESEGLRVAASMNMEAKETPSLSEGCRAAKISDVLEVNGKNVMEGSSGAANTLRQKEGDIPDSTQKKKRKNNKSRAESVGQEVDVRVDDSVVSVSCNVEDDGKKKKKRKRSGEDVEQLQSGAVAEPLNDDADIQKKKKKRKKELGIVITEEHEVEEASNRTLDLSPVSTEPLEASGHCSEIAATAQETVASSFVKRKKHKKKQQSFSNNAPRDREEGADVSFDLDDDSVTLAKDSGTSLKKKRKSLSEGRYFSSYTPEEQGKVKNVYHQKTNEDLEEQNAEPVTKKKSEIFSRGVSEDKVVQSDDSASAREKEKKRNSSFLIADAEENYVEELNDGVTKRKRKRKRKTSAEQHSVENGHEQDCEEPDERRRGALPQSTDTGRKKKKKRTGSESEGLDGAADAAFSPHDEVLKKKKKKCNDVMKEGPPTATTCSSVSCKEKGKRCGGVKVSHDGSTHASTETLTSVECDSTSLEMPGSQASKDARDKKKKKKKLQNVGKSSIESAELEPIENKMKQEERNNQSTTPETSDIVKKKHRKLKQKLHNPNEDFFTDC